MNLKIEHKILIIGLILFSVYFSSFLFYKSNVNEITQNISNLNENNKKLQKTLEFVSNLETINKLVIEYTYTADKRIEKQIKEIDKKIESDFIVINNEPYLESLLKKVFNNYKGFKDSFNLAKKNIPLNFEFRKKVRDYAQKIEDKLDFIKLKDLKEKDIYFDLIIFRKHLLEIEKNLVKYFETNNNIYIDKLYKHINYAKNKFNFLNNYVIVNKEIEQEELNSLILLVNQTLTHYRTYSMITKVLIPGNIYEITYNLIKIEDYVGKEIKNLEEEINTILAKNQKNSTYFFALLSIILPVVLFIIYKIIFNPLKNLTFMFEKLINNEEINVTPYTVNDSLGKLTNVAIEFKNLNHKTNILLKQTEDYKNNLEEKVQEEIKLRREQEKLFMHQSKLAAMGEMIGAIAHQWRQPLNELSIRIQKLKYNYAKDEINKEFIDDFILQNKKTILFMSNTIDDFRNFFIKDKNKKEFSIKESVNEAIKILDAQLKDNFIDISIEGNDSIIIGYKGEFQQVLLNIISNSKSAFISNKIENPEIKIVLKNNCIIIKDNAGGIEEDIIDRVFEPYFTTKEQGEGTGLGLYMSKSIIEKNMQGQIYLENSSVGLNVIINLKDSI